MTRTLPNLKKTSLILFIAAAFTACKKDDDKPALRAKMDYSAITGSTTYGKDNGLFLDATGQSTVDVSEGNTGYKSFVALNNYLTLSRTQPILATTMQNMYSNTGSPFTDASLNTSGVNIRSLTATSWSTAAAEGVRAKFNTDFTAMALESQAFGANAAAGIAGKMGIYLFNGQGIETHQIIQKGLIGAYQVDYICNVLLNSGLEADNSSLVSGKNYTQLEHNWDVAYGTLTLNPNFLIGSTKQSPKTSELFLGKYILDYNDENYTKILPAFLKGRAAIVNNDKTELKKQALFIRTELEKTLALSALGYLTKSVGSGSNDSKAHAFSEGLGFIYALRFASVHGGNAQFSDEVLNDLVGSSNGYWDLTAPKTIAASTKIKAKFNIQ